MTYPCTLWPQVADAVAMQMGVLNTNSRYLHEARTLNGRHLVANAAASASFGGPLTASTLSAQNFSSHAAALAALMPEPLEIMYATCSGSESNDLALRVAKKANQHGEPSKLAGSKPTYFIGVVVQVVHLEPCPPYAICPNT